MIQNEGETVPEEVELTATLTLTGSAAPDTTITRAPTPRPACSHGWVFGAPGWGPGGHLCGELPSGTTRIFPRLTRILTSKEKG